MADLAETRKGNNLLLGDVHKHLLAEHDKPTDRRQDILHPSEMAKADWCPRESYYRLAGVPPEKGRKFSAQLEGVFEEGHMIHAKWQKWLQDMGRLWGKWYCILCDEYWTGMSEDAEQRTCWDYPQHRKGIQYKEVPLEAEEKYLIAGHEDGAIADLNALVEVKSIGLGTVRFDNPKLLREYTVKTEDGKTVVDIEGLWKGLRRPFPGHIRQTQIYLALCQVMGLPYDKVIFLYEFKANQAQKEFVVQYNPEIAEPLLEQALDVKYALNKGKPPSRPAFTGQDTSVCKSCPFTNTCWKGTDDAHGSEEGLGRGEDSVSADDRSHGEGRAIPAGEARGRRSRTAGGPHRAKRRRVDDAVERAGSVGGIRGSHGGSGGGGREVARRVTRAS